MVWLRNVATFAHRRSNDIPILIRAVYISLLGDQNIGKIRGRTARCYLAQGEVKLYQWYNRIKSWCSVIDGTHSPRLSLLSTPTFHCRFIFITSINLTINGISREEVKSFSSRWMNGTMKQQINETVFPRRKRAFLSLYFDTVKEH